MCQHYWPFFVVVSACLKLQLLKEVTNTFSFKYLGEKITFLPFTALPSLSKKPRFNTGFVDQISAIPRVVFVFSLWLKFT